MEQLFQLVSITLITFFLAAGISVPIINILYRFKIIRHSEVDFSTLIESRKIKEGTPIMGGLIFIFSVMIVNIIFNFSLITVVILLIFSCAALLGAIDDILNIFGQARKARSIGRIIKLIKVHKSVLVRLQYLIFFPWFIFERFMHSFESNPGSGLRAHEKLIIQGILGIILGIFIYRELGGFLWLPFFAEIDLGYLIIPFAVFVLLGFTNAVNISDGLDGLAAGMAAIAFIGFMLIGVIEQNFTVAFIAGSVVGGLLAYLYFNISPARVQMGDTGSFALGALLTSLAFILGKPLLLPVIAAPIVVEILSTIIQSFFRRVLGRRLFKMAPLHHHFELLGWSEEKVMMRFWLFSIFCMLLGLWLYFL